MKTRIYTLFQDSPLGTIRICGDGTSILEVDFIDEKTQVASTVPVPELLLDCAQQLREYFDGSRRVFNVPVKTSGTPFQEKVWAQLQKIPYGQTRSYLDIAEATGNARAVRAVGGANHNNPVSIIIPCHRVIGKNGRLVGYGGGLDRKKWLLDHEKRQEATDKL